MAFKSNLKNTVNAIKRWALAYQRPSKQSNLNKLNKAGLSLHDFIIRKATAEDIPALSVLHAEAWHQTYPNVNPPPTAQLRQQQWQQQFEVKDGSWFCIVVQLPTGGLIGFAKGKTYAHPNLPQYNGELNKIYLLADYQRLGLGKKMLCCIINNFKEMGIFNMVLFGTAYNPSGYFHEAMGATRIYAENGEFHGGYAWNNLRQLSFCNNE